MRCIALKAILGALILCLPNVALHGQTFNVLHAFPNIFPKNHGPVPPDGAMPNPELILIGSTLYGSASVGGTNGGGTVFSLQTDGTNFGVIHEMDIPDGVEVESLALGDGQLYGTTLAVPGQPSLDNGSVFSMDLNSGALTTEHVFHAFPTDGVGPRGPLVFSGGTVYGTTGTGGTRGVFPGSGIIFALDLASSNLTVLHAFSVVSSQASATNSDGAYPLSGLLLLGDTLYGTAPEGGGNGSGTIFSVNTNGTTFKVLHTFSANNGVNLDGDEPFPALTSDGNTLYGATDAGGKGGNGTIFSIGTDGTAFKVLHSFSPVTGSGFTNADGAQPGRGPGQRLALSGNTLYGVAQEGGANGVGTVYSINTDGSAFTVLHHFGSFGSQDPNVTGSTNVDGGFPRANLVVSGNTLYGTTPTGGPGGYGTVFSLTISPAAVVPNLVASIPTPGSPLSIEWPDSLTGYVLETTRDLSSSATWQPYTDSLIDTNGYWTAQISIKDAGPLFFRLHHL